MLITLLTDFGLRDHFVASMKGVIKQVAPTAEIIDLTHDIEAFDMVAGSLILSEVAPLFPQGTIHVAVVDPGVGSARRPLLAAANGQYFIGPDNGLLALATKEGQFFHLDQPQFWRPEVSQTFHGRDIFAPVAAHLLSGVAPKELGSQIEDWVRLSDLAPTQIGSRSWAVRVLRVDQFGNLITNLRPENIPQMATNPWKIQAGASQIERLTSHYQQLGWGEIGAILGSSGYVEIVANQANASAHLKLRAGSPIEFEWFRV
jgi:S-adenosyl-L-methionine hydrolase (adenosine-forming)